MLAAPSISAPTMAASTHVPPARNADARSDERIAAADWPQRLTDLNTRGHVRLPALLSAAECAALIGEYADMARFRRRVIMARHGFGQGEYQYFAYPLPVLVQSLREAFYVALVDTANRWQAALGSAVRYPATLDAFLARCRDAAQTQPTPLLLKYGPGDYNCLHQDLYGEHAFPLQVAVLLSQPGRDFDGGEFVLTQQRPRRQSRVDVVTLQQGDAVVFAVSRWPAQGRHGNYTATLRHGVSELRAGARHTLGIILHDAV